MPPCLGQYGKDTYAKKKSWKKDEKLQFWEYIFVYGYYKRLTQLNYSNHDEVPAISSKRSVCAERKKNSRWLK